MQQLSTNAQLPDYCSLSDDVLGYFLSCEGGVMFYQSESNKSVSSLL